MNEFKNIEAVVFDLDGTLFSSHEAIYRCTLKTFEELNIPVKMDEEKFYKLIGHHFADIFSEFGIEVDDLEGFIDLYKTFYFDYIDTCKPYKNVYETIDLLYASGYKLALLTTKGNDQANKIMKHFKLHEKFNIVRGRLPGVENKPSPQPLKMICDELSVDVSRCLMVGDSELDVRCGKNAGAFTAAVTYGYRTLEELKKENPDFILNDISELKNILNGAEK